MGYIKSRDIHSYFHKAVAKTADYTITARDCATTFTNRGAAARVIFTLPAIANVPSGFWVRIVQAAEVELQITGATGDQLMVGGTDGANTISSNAGNKSDSVECQSDGTDWIVHVINGTWGIIVS